MPRLPRLHVPGGFYHVILRGNHREDIFSCPQDRDALNAFVAEALEKYGARLHAFCWMTNHLHALIQIGDQPLGKLVQRIAIRYARFRHKQLRTTGHLFERRHRAWLVDVESYFLAVLRYIHFNPVEARIVNSPDDYRWSSHHVYVGTETLSWVTTEFGLGLMSKTITGAREAYRALIDGVTASSCAVNEWAPSDDPRVIGTDRFLASLPPPRMNLRTPTTLAELAASICARLNLSEDAVTSPVRNQLLSSARAEIARRATLEGTASLHEVARYLGRSPSTLHELVKRYSGA